MHSDIGHIWFPPVTRNTTQACSPNTTRDILTFPVTKAVTNPTGTGNAYSVPLVSYGIVSYRVISQVPPLNNVSLLKYSPPVATKPLNCKQTFIYNRYPKL